MADANHPDNERVAGALVLVVIWPENWVWARAGRQRASMTKLTKVDKRYAASKMSCWVPANRCIDCHDPETMQLRITRPAFMEGIRALKASQGIQNYDVSAMVKIFTICEGVHIGALR